MGEIAAVNRVYQNCRDLLDGRVEMVAIDDPIGAAFDKRLRMAERRCRNEELVSCSAVLQILKAIRWRRAVTITPLEYQPSLEKSLEKARDELQMVAELADESEFLEEVVELAFRMANETSPLAQDLIDQCEDVGCAHSLVVVKGVGVAQEYEKWLARYRIQVLPQSYFLRTVSCVEKAFLIGPPFFYGNSLLKAGRAPEMAVNFPSWISGRKLRQSPLEPFYKQRFTLTLKDFSVIAPEGSESSIASTEDCSDLSYEPREPEEQFSLFDWPDSVNSGGFCASSSSPAVEEARLYLLAGGKEVYLEVDGESVRCVDLDLQDDRRVTFTRIGDLEEGDYILLGMGENEKGVVYTKVAEKFPSAAETQALWKSKLRERLDRYGEGEVERKLRIRGVNLHIRYYDWTAPFFIHPRNESHFRALLDYLNFPIDEYVHNAKLFRLEMRREERANRRKLENLISHEAAEELRSQGFVYLNPKDDGSSGLFAGRLIGVSPRSYRVSRTILRVPRDSNRAEGLF